MYEFSEETSSIVDLVSKLNQDYQMPLERRILAGETLTAADFAPGTAAAKDAGLWGLTCPEELGGTPVSLVTFLAITEELGKALQPMKIGGSTNLPFLYHLKGEQKAKYTDPILSGEKEYSFAQTEPGGGADPARAIATKAVKDGDSWVINGSKIWISNHSDADFVFVAASTDKEKGAGGISIFGVETSNPGVIAREVPMLGTFKTHQLIFDDCRVDELALLEIEGGGFTGAQKALSAARFEVGARAIGIAQRCYEMMVEYAKARVVFGSALSEKQAIQSMIVDSWIELQKNRLMMYTAAEKAERGEDVRVEAGLVKMEATEMVCRIVDRAIQVHGGAGCTYESPLAHWYDRERLSRIYEGPTEVHKYRVLARHLLG
jgi:acyl-CoA dehydrogenase